MSRHASVQTAHVPIERIEDDVLCLGTGACRAVLEVGTINFALQGEVEQEAVIAGFAAFLNTLTFPVQILVRVLPIEVERYLTELEDRSHHLPDELADLARDHVTFLRRLARNRALLERRFYLILPAQAETQARRIWPLTRQSADPGADAARRQLTFRCEEVERQLDRCGLKVRRLVGGELAQLFYACFCSEQARTQRLAQPLLAVTAPVVARPGRSF